MTEFTKTKMNFALALLGTCFALHPVLEALERNRPVGFVYLGVFLPAYYAYGLTIVLLAAAVYCFAVALVSHRSSSLAEHTGNSAYAAATLVLPLYAGLYVASVLADHIHSDLAWLAPSVAFGIGILWLLLSHLVVHRFGNRLAEQDRSSVLRQLAGAEVEALKHAREMFAGQHYDLSVMETWRAVEARLRRILALRKCSRRLDAPHSIIAAAHHTGVLTETTRALLDDLHRVWEVSIGFVPVPREDAERALHAGRTILASLPVENSPHQPGRNDPPRLRAAA